MTLGMLTKKRSQFFYSPDFIGSFPLFCILVAYFFRLNSHLTWTTWQWAYLGMAVLRAAVVSAVAATAPPPPQIRQLLKRQLRPQSNLTAWWQFLLEGVGGGDLRVAMSTKCSVWRVWKVKVAQLVSRLQRTVLTAFKLSKVTAWTALTAITSCVRSESG